MAGRAGARGKSECRRNVRGGAPAFRAGDPGVQCLGGPNAGAIAGSTDCRHGGALPAVQHGYVAATLGREMNPASQRIQQFDDRYHAHAEQDCITFDAQVLAGQRNAAGPKRRDHNRLNAVTAALGTAHGMGAQQGNVCQFPHQRGITDWRSGGLHQRGDIDPRARSE